MDQLTGDVRAAIACQDWDEIKRVLHPYVRWTEHGVLIRGRTKVMWTSG